MCFLKSSLIFRRHQNFPLTENYRMTTHAQKSILLENILAPLNSFCFWGKKKINFYFNIISFKQLFSKRYDSVP